MSAGQVAAKVGGSFSGLHGDRIKENDLARIVRQLSPKVNGKAFGEGTDLVPVKEAGQLLKITIRPVEGQKGVHLKSDRLLYDSHNRPLAGGVHITKFQKLLGRNRLVLYDKDQKPLVVAVQDTKEVTHKAYHILGPTPLHQGDKRKEKEGGVDLYPWIRVSDVETDMQLPHRQVSVWNGLKYMDFISIRQAEEEKKHVKDKVVLKKGEFVVVEVNNESSIYGLILKKGSKRTDGWELIVAPGVDPVMMIMFAATLDEMVHF
jgi:hypothetical protein